MKRKDTLFSNGDKKRVRIGSTTTYQIPPQNDLDDSEDLETIKKRRGALQTSGYESDEEAGFDSDLDSQADDDPPPNNNDDMFAEEAPKKKTGFLSKSQIEGQEWGDSVAEDGVKMMPFNMSEELDEVIFNSKSREILIKKGIMF
jgi:hypothetical protein